MRYFLLNEHVQIFQYGSTLTNKWDKVFKKGPCKICGRQPLKNCTWSILEYFVPNNVLKYVNVHY